MPFPTSIEQPKGQAATSSEEIYKGPTSGRKIGVAKVHELYFLTSKTIVSSQIGRLV
jgi:hypothetical protein